MRPGSVRRRDAIGEALANAFGRLRPNTPAGHLGKLLVDLGELEQRCGRPLREVMSETRYRAATAPILDVVADHLSRAAEALAPLVVDVERLERTPSEAWPYRTNRFGGAPRSAGIFEETEEE